MFEEVLALRRSRLGPDHPDTIKSLGYLAEVYIGRETLRRGRRLASREPGPQAGGSSGRLGAVPEDGPARRRLAGQGRNDEAEPLLLEGYEGLLARWEQIPVPRRKALTEAGARIVTFYEVWNKPELATAWREKHASSAGGAVPRP